MIVAAYNFIPTYYILHYILSNNCNVSYKLSNSIINYKATFYTLNYNLLRLLHPAPLLHILYLPVYTSFGLFFFCKHKLSLVYLKSLHTTSKKKINYITVITQYILFYIDLFPIHFLHSNDCGCIQLHHYILHTTLHTTSSLQIFYKKIIHFALFVLKITISLIYIASHFIPLANYRASTSYFLKLHNFLSRSSSFIYSFFHPNI